MRTLFLRQCQRLMLQVAEIALAALGFTVSGLVAAVIASWTNNDLAMNVFLCASALTALGVWLFRRRTRKWKLDFDASTYCLIQEERKLHRVRHRNYCRAIQVLVWLPSGVAAAVLFFLPVVSHVFYPRSHYLKHYRIPIPWNVLVLPWPGGVHAYAARPHLRVFGATHFSPGSLSSGMDFRSSESNWMPAEGIGLRNASREFRYGDVVVSCRKLDHPRGVWYIYCDSPANVREHNFHALFVGTEEDIGLFYKILEGVQRIE